MRIPRARLLAALSILLVTVAGPAFADAPGTTMVVTSTSGIAHRDVGDVTTSPAWRPGMPSGHNNAWATYLDAITDQVTAAGPDVLLHTGDMVEGRWTAYHYPNGVKPFGPADRLWQKRRTIERAAQAYYPWISRWFEQDAPEVFYAMGDHEIGDISATGVVPPDKPKSRLLGTYKAQWQRHLGTWRKSQYAVLRGNVGIITLDPFHGWKVGTVAAIDAASREFLRDRVASFHARGADWIIVQCEIPAIGPNNQKGSSGLLLRNGRQVWRLLQDLDVDLLLGAEFHDDTIHTSSGRRPVQVVHGGSEGRASWLDIEVHGNSRLDLTLWQSVGGWDGDAKVWAMSKQRAHSKPGVGAPEQTGSATLWRAGGLTRRTGRLAIEGLR